MRSPWYVPKPLTRFPSLPFPHVRPTPLCCRSQRPHVTQLYPLVIVVPPQTDISLNIDGIVTGKLSVPADALVGYLDGLVRGKFNLTFGAAVVHLNDNETILAAYNIQNGATITVKGNGSPTSTTLPPLRLKPGAASASFPMRCGRMTTAPS